MAARQRGKVRARCREDIGTPEAAHSHQRPSSYIESVRSTEVLTPVARTLKFYFLISSSTEVPNFISVTSGWKPVSLSSMASCSWLPDEPGSRLK